MERQRRDPDSADQAGGSVLTQPHYIDREAEALTLRTILSRHDKVWADARSGKLTYAKARETLDVIEAELQAWRPRPVAAEAVAWREKVAAEDIATLKRIIGLEYYAGSDEFGDTLKRILQALAVIPQAEETVK